MRYTNFDIDSTVIKCYRNYTYERANIYFKKEIQKLPFPWTDDPILQKYSFTNVKRYLDRQSIFLIDKVINNDSLSLLNKFMNCFLFRNFNLDTATVFFKQYPIDFDNFNYQEFLDYELKQKSEIKTKVLLQSPAYILVGSKVHIFKKLTKIANAVNPENTPQSSLALWTYLNKPAFEKCIALSSPMDIYNTLLELSGMGRFLAYQIWIDFSYIKETPYTDSDIVISGPGCDKGIDWITGETCKISKDEFILEFHDKLPQIMKDFNLTWNPEEFLHFLPKSERKWTLMDIENSFCELQKYMKVYAFNKSPKRTYKCK